MLSPRHISAASAQAVFAYLANGGTIARYPSGARALPPAYSDDSPRPPAIYCHHQPESVSAPGI